MYRSLIHHAGINLAVTLAAAVATAVLAGALLVGDSVRGSLQALTLDRLGRIDSALVSHRFFRPELADDLAAHPEFSDGFLAVAPAIVVRGSVSSTETGARASQVTILGIDQRLAAFYDTPDGVDPARTEGQVFASAIINASLQRELAVEPGAGVVLRFGRFSEIPRDTLMGEKDPDDVLGRLRAEVTRVLPDEGIGRFALDPRQQDPLVALVDLRVLQRALDVEDVVNGLFVQHRTAADDSDPQPLLDGVLEFDDLGLRIGASESHFIVESDEYVLRPVVARAVADAAGELGAPLLEIQSYLANDLRVGDRGIPYSMVVAVDPLAGEEWAELVGLDGAPLPPVGDDGILLNAWAADDLDVEVGDALRLAYYEVGPHEELRDAEAAFVVRGISALDGLGADRRLTPDYPGIENAEDISAWDPPFPVDLDRVRPEDESYWDTYGATPKAFVSRATGRRLWTTRFGDTTSAWVGAGRDLTLEQTVEGMRQDLLRRLPPETFGFDFRPVKALGLQAAAGATDFSMLFISFSFFLIVSAAMLVGLLFGLNVERRGKEIGLLLAVGYPIRKVMRGLLREGLALASVGALVGLAGGVGYAWLLMAALRTIWVGAVGSSALYLHVRPQSLAIGWFSAVLVILLSVWIAVRRLRRIPPPLLLAGSFRPAQRRGRGRFAPLLAHGGAVVALSLAGFAVATGKTESMGLAFGTGTLLLISGLAYFSLWCRGRGETNRGWLLSAAIAGMAARNTAWSPGRSILSVALVASASFMIVAVGANRAELGAEQLGRDSGTGGFRLLAESDVPLHQDLGSEQGRIDLGFDDEEAGLLSAAQVLSFRYLPGEDASCLNLYQPEKPRVLGVPRGMIDRGGFRFAGSLDPTGQKDNPWVALRQVFDDGAIPAIGDAHSLQWILHKKLGDDIELENEYGETVRLRMVGSLDRSIFQSELLVAEEAFLKHFPSRTGYAYFLLDLPEGQDPRATAQVLENRLDGYGFDATTTLDKLISFLVVEHTYLSTFQMLGGLGLLLGTIGLGVVLIRNVIERRGELATLRAFGFRRKRLAMMVLAENLFLLAIGMTAGTLAALVAVAPRLATIQVDWTSLGLTLLAVLLFGMLSSTFAVLGTLRVPLLPALKAD